MDTVLTAWLSMGIVIVAGLFVTKNLNRVPGKVQVVAEGVMKFLDNISTSQMGEKEGIKHTPLVGSLFLFILVGNLLVNLPLNMIHIPGGEFASPTNDLNTTVALAVMVLIYYISVGIRKKGFKYFAHYFKPFPFLAPLNLLEDFTRPVSLAVRLFGNILAGEVIIGVLIAFLFLFPYLILFTDIIIIVMVLFELFVAVIQAFIFAVLTASYVAGAVSEEH
jgi:F-type H+-transporting ATPase subunit a